MSRLAVSMKAGIGLRLLGPVEARAAGGWLTAPPQQRLVLALLALQVGHVIPVGELIDALWPEAPPASARASIQAMITRLRQVLAGSPAGLVERCGDGYRLLILPNSIDVQQFRSLARAGRDASDSGDAVAAFDQGLSLWRGPALADVASTARIEAIRFALAEERLSAVQDRISALLDLGRYRQAAEELTSLVADQPLAERPVALLMVALYHCGRQADALRAFRDLRGRLSDELAVEPGRELQHLHRQVLAGGLAPSGAAGRPAGPVDPLRRAHRRAAGGEPLVIPRQLPTAVAHFVGREAELRVLDSVLERTGSTGGAVAISAITGTAGVGKTALAVHWAHRVTQQFPDGQLYVNLRAFGASRQRVSPGEAIRGFLDALGIPPHRRPAGLEAQAALYRSALSGRRMLVVLDNAADEEQVRPMLPGTAGCLVLVTSRRRLPGLGAREGATLLTLDVLTAPEAVELLARRIGAELTAAGPEAASQLATLCARLPLALSAAAVRAAEHPHPRLPALTARLQELSGRLEVLEIGERATSVRSVLSWSYQALSEPAARMFRLLGVHPGPDVSLAAAAALIGRPRAQAARILAELVSAHVLTEHVPGRWVFHDLLRAYASEQARCHDRAERDEATRRVLDYYLHTAWSAAVMLRPAVDPDLAPAAPCTGGEPEAISSPAGAIAWYEGERQVLLAASSWAAAEGLDGYAWRLPWALTDYLSVTGRWDDQAVSVRTALVTALRRGEQAGQARAHRGLGCALFSADQGIAGH